MTQKTKKLYFTNDFSPENVEKLQGEGWSLRNRAATHKGDFIEDADEYGGDVPDWYREKGEQITVTLNTEIAPELQQAINDAKAECEKVVAENAELQAERDALSTRAKELDLENTELKEALQVTQDAATRIAELEAALSKATAKTTKAAKAEQPKE